MRFIRAPWVGGVRPRRLGAVAGRVHQSQLPEPYPGDGHTSADPAGVAAASVLSGRWHVRAHIDRMRLVAMLTGVAAALVVGGWFGLLAGLTVGLAADWGMRRFEPAQVRARQAAEAAQLPLAADLLAEAMHGGIPVERALTAVAEVLPGPLGQRLAHVARMLALGATAAQAWQQLAPVPGADRLVRAAVRSAEHGGALAATFRRLAEDLRADRAVAAEAASRRAGVLIVLPLAFCFLPAFMLAGLVPVIVAVLGELL